MYGTLFVSLPSLLDHSLSPPGTHIVHAFTPDWIDAWQVGCAAEPLCVLITTVQQATCFPDSGLMFSPSLQLGPLLFWAVAVCCTFRLDTLLVVVAG